MKGDTMTEQPEWMTPDPWEVERDRRRNPVPWHERRREYHREYARRRREERWEGAIGALHSLSCDGKHGRRGNRYCQPIPVFS